MSNFRFDWSSGTVIDIDYPSYAGVTCHTTSLAEENGGFASKFNQIYQGAFSEPDLLNEVEQYCQQAIPVINSAFITAKGNKDFAYDMYKSCKSYNNIFRYCYNSSRFCYISQGTWEKRYKRWKAQEQALSSIYTGIVQAKVDATTQIAIDNQQAIDLQELNQLIAQTNQITSLATYQNETRELKLTKEKTANYFLPIILILVLLTLTIYYFKK